MHRALFARLARLSFGPIAAVLLAPGLAVAQLTVQDQTDPTVTPASLAQELGRRLRYANDIIEHLQV